LILVSSCLLGISCRYDGSSRPCPKIFDIIEKAEAVVPVCPEQLGGLSTPRPPAAIMGGDGFDVLSGRARVIRLKDGKDITSAFLSGAEQCLKLVKIFNVTRAVLKAGSPSCGLGRPSGVTAAALILKGMDVLEF